MNDFQVGRRQLYILPTRIGWYFGLVLLALFGIAIKYDNQAAFMMLFILTSMGILAMHHTHNNVINLELRTQGSKSVFVGETAIFPVQLINNTPTQRIAVWLACGGFTKMNDLKPFKTQTIELQLPSVQRGYLNCEPICLTSQFPLGLLFCWTKQFISPQRCLVYPQPLDLTPLIDLNSQDGQQDALPSVAIGAQDYNGMKAYQPGDQLRDIHWPSLAKTNKLVSIQYEKQSNSSINLSWFALPKSMSTEDKLSQLCFWVIQAEKAQQRYQLEMPSHTIEVNLGTSHYHECLSTLALWTES